MQVWTCCLLLLFAQSLALEEEEEEDDDDEHEGYKVGEHVGAHQLERLVELLTPSECDDLLVALSQSENVPKKHLEKQHIVKRHVASPKENEAKCRKGLTDWLQKNGPKIYYDRLTQSLRRINRPDIATELGKNIIQDKIVNLKRYAEGYHYFIKSLNTEEAEPETDQTKRLKRASDLTWRDLDLIVERLPVPAYSKSPLDVALPLLYGILLGFGGTLLAAVSTFYAVLRISRQSQQRRPPRVSCLPSYELIIKN
ncbi:transmembrane and death domain protein 1 isoform X2 [Vanacampus margaritifer]